MIEWINLISTFISAFLLCYLYTLSVQPMKREEKRGERAWKECQTLRTIGAFFEFLIAINLLLWIWFPVPSLNWKIFINHWIGIAIFLVISITGVIIILIGNKHAGKETYAPSKETEMYGGIYNHIRHPQTLGEFAIFMVLPFLINSWFHIIMMSIIVIIYLPTMVHYEEQDLIRRFGDSFREYQKRTGALFPKFWKKSN